MIRYGDILLRFYEVLWGGFRGNIIVEGFCIVAFLDYLYLYKYFIRLLIKFFNYLLNKLNSHISS